MSRNCQAVAFKLSRTAQYGERMEQNRTNQIAEVTTAPEIDALLSLGATQSIFDSVMAMPVSVSKDGVWERAVSQRLQTKLVSTLRARLGDQTPTPKAA